MNITFSIQTLGYIIAEIQFNGGKIKIGHSSTYGDKFQELLNQLFIIYTNCKESDDTFFPYAFEVNWYDDRINYLWSVSVPALDAEIEMEIFEVSTVDSAHKWQILKERIKFQDLFEAIYSSLRKMLKEFGLIGYKTNWEVGNFPIYEYLKLKTDKYGWDIQKEKVSEDDSWKSKVSFEDECKILFRDFIENRLL